MRSASEDNGHEHHPRRPSARSRTRKRAACDSPRPNEDTVYGAGGRGFPASVPGRRRSGGGTGGAAGGRPRLAVVGLPPDQRANLLHHRDLGSRTEPPQVRGAGVRLRHHRHLGHCHAAGRAAGRGNGDLPRRGGPALAAQVRLVPGGDARGHPQRRLRLLGAIRVRPGAATADRLVGRAGPSRHRPAAGRPSPRHHDHPLRVGRLLRRDPGRASVAARRRVGRGRHPLADDSECYTTLRTAGHHGRFLPRPGPRPRRDDGRDHAHRQPPGHQLFHLRQGQLDPQRHRQRVHRGHL